MGTVKKIYNLGEETGLNKLRDCGTGFASLLDMNFYRNFLLFVFLLSYPCYAGIGHSLFSQFMRTTFTGVLVGTPSDNPEVVPLGFSSCSGTWVSDNTLVTAAHCLQGEGVQVWSVKIEKKMENGKETINKSLLPKNLDCKKHPKYVAYTPNAKEEELREKVKSTYEAWKISGRMSGATEENAFRMTHEAWKTYTEENEKDELSRFLKSQAYDVAVCVLTPADASVQSACVISERANYDSKKNYIFSGFGLSEIGENRELLPHEAFTQTEGKAKMRAEATEQPSILTASWKRSDPNQSASGKGDSGGFMGEQIHESAERARQMRLHGVLTGASYVEEKFNENTGDFDVLVMNDKGSSYGVDLVASEIRDGFLKRPELLPSGAKINYCPN